MRYGHRKENSRWYEYGPGKEFETREEAINKLESDKEKSLTQFYLENLHKLYEGDSLEETKNAVRVVLRYKYVTSILK